MLVSSFIVAAKIALLTCARAQHLAKIGPFLAPVETSWWCARCKAEFVAKCGDSLRELEETAYWLELLVDGKIVAPETLSALRQECDELIAIFVTILKRSKETS